MANKKSKRESRTFGQIPELRMDGDVSKIVGYAAVFDDGTDGSRYSYWGITETIEKGAFARALKEKQDVRGLFNHDSGAVLGRISSGTLTLVEDDKGLRYEIAVPNTTHGRDLAELVKRGDINGSSFTFRVKKEAWERAGKEPNVTYLRRIQDVDLIDVGPVTFPAYEGTTASSRADEETESQEALLERAKAETEPPAPLEENTASSNELETIKARTALAIAGV